MTRNFPPRGYRAEEYPLPHKFSYEFPISVQDETENSTICTILRASEAATGVEAIEVNPQHTNFAEETGTTIHKGSIVPRINVTMHAELSIAAVAAGVKFLKLNWMPIYTSFVDNLEADDVLTAIEIEDVLELAHDLTNKDVNPLFSSVNMRTGASAHPFSNINDADEAFGDLGLTTNPTMESVAFDPDAMFDMLRFMTNSGMLKQVMGQWHTVVVSEHRPWFYNSNNFTNPKVKRGNPFTFCGVLIHMDLMDNPRQFYTAGEVTDISHVQFGMNVNYDEWNPNFDQTVL